MKHKQENIFTDIIFVSFTVSYKGCTIITKWHQGSTFSNNFPGWVSKTFLQSQNIAVKSKMTFMVAWLPDFQNAIPVCFLLFVYICIAAGDPIMKMKRVGIPLTGLTLPYLLCLSQSRTLISNAICCGLICVQWYWGEKRLFVLLILVDLLTITV